MSLISKIWSKAILLGTSHSSDVNLTTRIMHTNRTCMYSFLLHVFFASVFLTMQLPILALIIFVFITLMFLVQLLTWQGKYNASRILFIAISNLIVFIFSIILGEDGGTYFLFFCIITCVFTFFGAKEKELLILSVLISPFLWLCLELSNYELFKIIPKITSENLSLLKFLAITTTFLCMFVFLFDFMVFSYKNEDLLNSTILTLRTKEKELTEKNKDYLTSTKELLSIQQLLSANQVNLEEEKSKAEKALKVKTDFLSSMSHEIRTPMNVIVGLTDILLDTEIDHEKLENLHLIKNSSDNLLVIINDILDFSKMDSGKLIIENIEFDLFNKLNDVRKFIEVRTKENNNTIDLKIDKNVPQFVSSDPVRITQVLMNLLSNANKFSKNGKIQLLVSLKKNHSPTKSNLLFEIRDNGIGIEKESLDKIFESFTQASSSTTRQYGGTGLGLPISKRIVDFLDGAIWVESEVNIGSSFFVDLPLKHKEFISKKQLKGLVCEDYEMNQMLIQKTFDNLEIGVDFALTFKEFKEKFSNPEYSFLMFDVNKDEFAWDLVKGFILDKGILQSKEVLVYSNFFNEEMAQMGIQIVSKPINNKEIKLFKDSLLSQKQ